MPGAVAFGTSAGSEGEECLLRAWGAGLGAASGGDWIERVRAISTGWLCALPHLHLRPIDVVVFHGSRRDLVLRGASRLDAFSGYPGRT